MRTPHLYPSQKFFMKWAYLPRRPLQILEGELLTASIIRSPEEKRILEQKEGQIRLKIHFFFNVIIYHHPVEDGQRTGERMRCWENGRTEPRTDSWGTLKIEKGKPHVRRIPPRSAGSYLSHGDDHVKSIVLKTTFFSSSGLRIVNCSPFNVLI